MTDDFEKSIEIEDRKKVHIILPKEIMKLQIMISRISINILCPILANDLIQLHETHIFLST